MEYKVSGSDLTSVADAIRTKGSTSAPLEFPSGFVSAIDDIPTGSGTLTTKTITANGTYNARSDSADGYSSVTVAVPSRLIRGMFTGSSAEMGTAKDVSIPYTGNGYPIACVIYPTAGSYKSGTDIYDANQRYAVVMYAMSKADVSAVPDYSDDTEKNWGFVISGYKYTEATSYTSSLYKNRRVYRNTSASATATEIVEMKSNTIMSVFIANTSYGFLAGTEYTYEIIYSE